MFYKRQYLPKTIIEQLTDSPEFVYELFDKMSATDQHSLGFLEGKDKQGQILFTIPIVCDKDSLKSYTTIKGTRLLNRFIQQSVGEKYPTLSNLEITPITIEQYYHRYNSNMDMNKLALAKSILEDFYNLEHKQVVYDKLGQEYKMTIISNADTTIGDALIVDRLYLQNAEGQFIGSLKVKYTTDTIRNKLNFSQDKASEQFVDCATIDYSDLKNEYKNKGLGYVMYFHMAQYLTTKNIAFRESTIQSDSARRLWKGIRNNLLPFINYKTINNKENTAFLSIGHDYCINFVDQKLQVETISSPKYKK